MNQAAPLLDVKNLTVTYATSRGRLTALNDVSFTIAKGQALGLAGESGSGKSTVGLALLGLFGPEASIQSGAMIFKGRDLAGLTPEQRRDIRGSQISVVFQDPFTSLNPALTVGQQVAEPLVFHKGLGEAEAQRQVVELLAKVGIPRPAEMAKAYPHQLSGGMQQRTLIATALACDPDLMILDEPTTALDVTIEAQILDLLEELCRQRELSILFISHNLGVVGRLCDAVCILYAGYVLETGPTDKVFSRPCHPYTKGLMASLPRISLDEKRRRLTPIPGNLPAMTELPSGCVFHPRCPFGEEACAIKPQEMAAISGQCQVRCWKAKEVAELPWEKGLASLTPAPAPKPYLPASQPLIQAQGLSKRFRAGGTLAGLRLNLTGKPGPLLQYRPIRITAVDQASVSIAPGEVVGLVGESGSGKTTLGRCLIRLLEPSSGRILLGGRDITQLAEKDLGELRQTAQIIFQNPDSSLNPRKNVAQIIGRPLRRFGLARGPQVHRRVMELLEMVRLSEAYAERYPHQLSGGEKQRVGIARALATSPKFIVCDEAVSALDVSVQAAILNLLSDLRGELNLAYLFISHDISVVAHLAGRIAVMYRGLICEEGTVKEVLAPPYHPYTEALLSAVPRLHHDMSQTRIRLCGDPQGSAGDLKGCRFHARCPRKMGQICEEKTPPVQEAAANHRIICHLPLGELRAAKPVV